VCGYDRISEADRFIADQDRSDAGEVIVIVETIFVILSALALLQESTAGFPRIYSVNGLGAAL